MFLQQTFLVILAINLSTVLSFPKYTIFAPQLIKGDDRYTATLDFSEPIGESLIICTIKQETGQNLNFYHKNFTIKDETFINLVFDEKFNPGDHWLFIESTNENLFETKLVSVKFSYGYEEYNIFIQTDKNIYKPGQDVQFRVVILDNNLFPVDKTDIQDLSIKIKEPQGFTLATIQMTSDNGENQRTSFSYNNGVTSNITVSLSEYATEGQWTLEAQTKLQTESLNIMVKDYDLPIANISINIPEFITKADRVLNFSINVFYTFGKPVKGEADVEVIRYEGCKKAEHFEVLRKTFQINENGQIKDSIDFFEYPNALSENCGEHRFILNVNVTDSVTGKYYFDSAKFDIIENEYRLTLIDVNSNYRAGKDLIQMIRLTKRDGKFLDKHELDKFICKAQLIENSETQEIGLADIKKNVDNIVCTFNTQINQKAVNFTVLREDRIVGEKLFYSSDKCIQDYIEVKLQNRDEKLLSGRNATFVIHSNKEIAKITYHTISKGKILESRSITFKSMFQTQVFQILITKGMLPEFMIIVHMEVKNDQNQFYIVSDAKRFQLTDRYYSNLRINVENNLVEPGDVVNMTIETRDDANVYLLAFDQSLVELEKQFNENDISEERVSRSLRNLPVTYDETDFFQKNNIVFESNAKRECEQESKFYDLYVHKHEDPVDNDKHKIRKNFRETWIWDDFEMSHGHPKARIWDNAPDGITTWKLTAFSISKKFGLGIYENPGYVKVFKNFFIKLNLPYSIQRQEEAEINVLVFNYHNSSMNIKLNIHENQTNRFEFKDCKKEFKLEPNEIRSLFCSIKASEAGECDIVAEINGIDDFGKVKLSDGELRKIFVLYEGLQREFNRNYYFDLTLNNTEENSVSQIVSIDIPGNIVSGSKTNMILSASTELIKIDENSKLKEIRDNYSKTRFNDERPSGCCQQRVSVMFPIVFWLDYLKLTKRITTDEIKKAIEYFKESIEHQNLCFQNPFDGSFVYQSGPGQSFVWQTAFTLKYLLHVKKYVDVDQTIIDKTVVWLKSLDWKDGIKEIDTGHIIYRTPTNAYLTVFVSTALKEAGENVNHLYEWMDTFYEKLQDPIDLIPTCYCLHLSNGKNKNKCYDYLMKNIKFGETGYYWTNKNNQPDLHLTAYALMTLIIRNDYKSALNVYKYILSKKDNTQYTMEGNLTDSYVTIISTEALAKFAVYSENTQLDENIKISFEGNGKKIVDRFHFTPKNNMTQVFETDSNTIITAEGYGKVLVNVRIIYNINDETPGQFKLYVKKAKKNEQSVNLNICLSSNVMKESSNVNIELDLPSGYTFDKDSMNFDNTNIDRIESKNSDTTIILYLKKIGKEDFCFDIPTLQSFRVSNLKPVPIKVYEHYDRSGMTVKTYEF